jgi:hypothetical protein
LSTGSWLRRRLRDPWSPDASARTIVHCSHHKVGTVWILGVLRHVAHAHGLDLAVRPSGSSGGALADLTFFEDSNDFRDSDVGRPYRGSHLIRDPRDVVVSAYFYHLWTEEAWAREPQERYDGKSYQQHLQGLTEPDGLLEQIRNAAVVRRMVAWDYTNPNIHEMRYEDLVADEREEFTRLFRSYGFNDSAVVRAVELAHKHSFEAKTKRTIGEETQTSDAPSHLRSGRPGQWRELFTPEHVACFKEVHGDAAVRLGYELNNDWG